MKVLYAIQGTGNGHTSRAQELLPVLAKHVDLDVLISGNQYDIELGYPIKYRLRGLSFVFGRNGGIDIWKTMRNIKLFQFFSEIKSVPVSDYDLVISDFEPITAWACKWREVPLIACSHQFSFTFPDVPEPTKKDFLGNLILRKYAPAKIGMGIHFKNYGSHIFTPIIRKELRDSTPTDQNYFVVYLPSYSNINVSQVLSLFPDHHWHVFSKDTTPVSGITNVEVFPLGTMAFMDSLIHCTGVICGAGFETPAEALFLQKKLLVVPMKNQIEQQYNAAALQELGVPVLPSFDETREMEIRQWIEKPQEISVSFSGDSLDVVHALMKIHCV